MLHRMKRIEKGWDQMGEAELMAKGPAPAVSVITPVYNVARYLPECLDSLLSQRLKDIEFICINDGSTDDSPGILKSYSSRDPRIVVIDKENSGYGASMNKGMDAARGEYVGIVESDDFASPKMFKKLYSFAKRHDCDVVKSNYFEHDDSGDREIRLYDAFPYRRVFDPRRIPSVMRVVPTIWAGLYRRSMLVDNGIRFNETPGASFQDTSFVQKTWMASRRAALLKDAFLHYRVDNSGSSVKSSTKVFEICGEYASSESFMAKDPALVESFAPTLMAMKFDAYCWNYGRISADSRRAFAERWAEEMRGALDKGWLDPTLLSEADRRRFDVLVADPAAFVDAFGVDSQGFIMESK